MSDAVVYWVIAIVILATLAAIIPTAKLALKQRRWTRAKRSLVPDVVIRRGTKPDTHIVSFGPVADDANRTWQVLFQEFGEQGGIKADREATPNEVRRILQQSRGLDAGKPQVIMMKSAEDVTIVRFDDGVGGKRWQVLELKGLEKPRFIAGREATRLEVEAAEYLAELHAS